MKNIFTDNNVVQLYYMSFAALHMRYKDDRLYPQIEGFFSFWVYFTFVIIMFVLCLLIRFPLFSNKSYAIIGFIICFLMYLFVSYRYIWNKTDELHIRAYSLDRKSKRVLVICSFIYTLAMPAILIFFAKLCHEIV